jgi:hypothetical protein
VPVTRLGRAVEGDAFTLGPIGTTTGAMLDAYESLLT